MPYEAIGDAAAIRAEKRRLSHKSPYQAASDPPTYMFKDLPHEGFLGMPRMYAMERYKWLPFEDRMTSGAFMSDDAASYILPSPDHPSVKEPDKQRRFMADLDQQFAEEASFMAMATTGSGKTVCGARAAIIRRRRTVIMLPLERLLDMWHDTLTGMFRVPEHRIGIVQSDRCEFEDCDFVLAMMKSLGNRRYNPEFYKSIGTVMPDECHRLGAPALAMVTAQFPARVRCGLSATPDRGDGSERVLYWHIGPIKVRSEATAVECRVFVSDYDDRGRMAAIPPLVSRPGEKKKSDHGYRIKALTKDETRNQTLARKIVRRWREGRKVLAIGEHVAHVQHIMELVIGMGVPAEVCGQCTGEQHKVTRKLVGTRWQTRTTKRKISREEFDRAKTQSDIVFATYGCFKEGIDEPRLDALVPLTPQAKDKQVRGRVRRPFNGKQFATYDCLRDTGDWMSMRYAMVREREWKADPTVRVFYNQPL